MESDNKKTESNSHIVSRSWEDIRLYNPDLQYFMVVAEELNITRAAQKLFMSQQSLSNYIQRLEQFYDIKLFERRPSLQFTYAGECLYETAKEIQGINQKLLKTFEEIRTDKKGRVLLGIPRPRGSVIIPDLLPRFKKAYPNVDLMLIEENTGKLAEMAMEKSIDLFIGFEPITEPDLNSIPLLHDVLYLMVSNPILREHFPEQYPDCIESFQAGVDLADVKHLPFILNGQGSTVRSRINRYFSQIDARLNIVFESASSDVTTELCMKNLGAGICSQMRLARTVRKIEQDHENGKNMNIFPITTKMVENTMVLAYPKDKQLTVYMQRLIQDIREMFKLYN